MATILDGRKLSQEILEDLRRQIKKSLPAGGHGGKRLKLAAVLVGEDKNSMIFLRQKEKACNFVGVDFRLYQFPENISQNNLEKEVKKICNQTNHGIIIQLPLPKHINAQTVLNLIPREKDIDILSEKSHDSKLLSPVLAGILELFKRYKIEYKAKNVAVVGRGRLVGKPVADWMKKHGAHLTNNTKEADILISGAGSPGLIKGSMVKGGAVVVDAAGDVDFKSVEPKAGYITPIPGGVGPMTVAMLFKNLAILNKT